MKRKVNFYTLFEIQKKIYLSLSHFLCLTGCINMAKVETKTSVGKEFSFSQYIPGPKKKRIDLILIELEF